MKNCLTLFKSYTAYVLFLSMLFQSCVAYLPTTTTLNNAVNNGPVKLVDYEGRIYKFESVGVKNQTYFGTGSVYSDLEFTITPEGAISILNSAKFNAIYLKDVKKSKRQSVWLGVGIALPVAYLLIGFIAFLAYSGI